MYMPLQAQKAYVIIVVAWTFITMPWYEYMIYTKLNVYRSIPHDLGYLKCIRKKSD